MARQNKLHLPHIRKRKAYYTAFFVFTSYYWLSFKSKFFGKEYYDIELKKVHLKNANRIKKRVDELEGLFIKFGQLISNLSNILPVEFREPLEELQDNVLAKDFEDIKATIKSELGKEIDEIFTDFNETPIAAASIGQAHKATLNGENVVVKIQHKNIDLIASADLEIIKNLVKIHAYFMDVEGLDNTYEQIKIMIEEELDYTNELKAMNQIAENFEDEDDLYLTIPITYNEFCTKKILVTQFHEGVKINDIQTLSSWNIDLDDIAKRLIEIYCKMVLIDGNYHADPHPGNILVNQDCEIILLDFGATAKLSAATKKAIPELIEALVKNDTQETIIALKKLGFLGSDEASRKFVTKLIIAFKDLIETDLELEGIDFQNIKMSAGLSSLSSFFKKINLKEASKTLKIPKEYILLNRTLILLVGNVFNLSPKIDILNVVRPYVQQNIKLNYKDYAKQLIGSIKNEFSVALSLPKEISTFLQNQKESNIEAEVSQLNNTIKGVQHSLKLIFNLLFILGIIVVFNTFISEPKLFSQIIYWALLSISSLVFVKNLWWGK